MSDKRKVRTLIIEDDAEDRALLRSILLNAICYDYIVVEVRDMKEARLLLNRSEHKPELIVLDLRLGCGKDYAALTSEVVGMVGEGSVVIVTGVTDRETAVQCMKAGAKDYLVKGEQDEAKMLKRIRDAVCKAASGRTFRAKMAPIDEKNAEIMDSWVKDSVLPPHPVR